MEKTKIKITLNEYITFDSFGTITSVNGVEMPLHNQDAPTIITQILEHLGYDVDMEYLFNGEVV